MFAIEAGELLNSCLLKTDMRLSLVDLEGRSASTRKCRHNHKRRRSTRRRTCRTAAPAKDAHRFADKEVGSPRWEAPQLNPNRTGLRQAALVSDLSNTWFPDAFQSNNSRVFGAGGLMSCGNAQNRTGKRTSRTAEH